jgi:hypothetical protein
MQRNEPKVKTGFNRRRGDHKAEYHMCGISEVKVRDSANGTKRRLRLRGKLGQLKINFDRIWSYGKG